MGSLDEYQQCRMKVNLKSNSKQIYGILNEHTKYAIDKATYIVPNI